jgi:hypothetical protein
MPEGHAPRREVVGARRMVLDDHSDIACAQPFLGLSADFAASFKASIDQVVAKAPERPGLFLERLRALFGTEATRCPAAKYGTIDVRPMADLPAA